MLYFRFTFALVAVLVLLDSALVSRLSGGLTVEPGGQALLIGVRDYENVSDLQYSRNDVNELAKVLHAGKYGDPVVMTGAADPPFRPTLSNIRDQLRRLSKSDRQVVVVAFSGHASHTSDGRELLLVPSDAQSDAPESMLPLAEVFASLEKCEASLKLVLVDAVNGADQLMSPPPGVVLLIASSPGGRAYESPELEHGIFTYVLIRALQGGADYDKDGAVTVPELELCIKRHVHSLARKLLEESQRPRRTGDAPGLQPIVALPWADYQTRQR